MIFSMNSIFFFKQKTAYEMRISDWSSDVCSSDLQADPQRRHDLRLAAEVDDRFGRLQADLDLRVRGKEATQPRHQPGRGHRRRCADREPVVVARGERLQRLADGVQVRSEEHTSELQSLMRISYAVFCLKKKNTTSTPSNINQ